MFLDKIVEDDLPTRITILTEYLESQKIQDDEHKTATYLSDIMQTWSLAAQTNNDLLLSAIPVTLTALFKILSSRLELVDFGARLGHTLLQRGQLELFARNVTTNKTKAFIIGPTLALLREIITFDGGALAKLVFRVRDHVLKALPRNLGVRKLGDGVEDPSKPSIRTHALRLIASLLKFSDLEAKRELLSQKDLVSALMRDLATDSPSLVIETLDTLKAHVLQDDKLPKEAKSRLFNPTSLTRLVTLYNYEIADDTAAVSTHRVRTAAHGFLMLACTSTEKGVLYKQSGFYPRGIDPDAGPSLKSRKSISLGLEYLEWAEKFTEKVPVRNTTLSEFIQTLRPWSDTRQAELLLAIFRAAPELVADYFFNKKSFTFEPKLTVTWVGYAAFLFAAVELPLPAYLGHRNQLARLPPPTSVVIESILPLPLTQKVLTRCLNQSSKMIRFFVIRILVIAFRKLKKMVALYQDAPQAHPIWQEALEQLIEAFSGRCPSMKDVLNAYKAALPEELMMKNAASQLMVLYYEVIPQIALDAKFDVSSALSEELDVLDRAGLDSKDFVMHVFEAENLFQIAYCSPGMRWFHKPDSRSTSPFTTMLRMVVEASQDVPLRKMHSVLRNVVAETDILQLQTRMSSVDALIGALKAVQDPSPVFDFLDNCASRCSSTPVKYIDAVGDIQIESDHARAPKHVSLLLLTMAEQWPFVVKADPQSSVDKVALFIAHYLAASLKIGEDKVVVKAIIKRCSAALPEKSSLRKLIEKCKRQIDEITISEFLEEAPPMDSITAIVSNTDLAQAETLLADGVKPVIEDSSALLKWTTKEIDETLEEGHAASLIMLLSSSHLHVRKEALNNILKLASSIKQSTHDEKEQLWLLLCEVAETSRPHIETAPAPTTISAFAAKAIDVLNDPLHCLYPKLNTFLTQGPTWDVGKIPMMQEILERTPGLDDAYSQEISWLLGFLATALRSSADLAIFHKRHAVEKLLSCYNNAYIAKGLKEQILRILYKATEIDGGSTTLVTRFSILAWLDAQISIEQDSAMLEVLRRRILETADHDRLQKWSSRDMAALRDNR